LKPSEGEEEEKRRTQHNHADAQLLFRFVTLARLAQRLLLGQTRKALSTLLAPRAETCLAEGRHERDMLRQHEQRVEVALPRLDSAARRQQIAAIVALPLLSREQRGQLCLEGSAHARRARRELRRVIGHNAL
jgi:hypothetical protein